MVLTKEITDLILTEHDYSGRSPLPTPTKKESPEGGQWGEGTMKVLLAAAATCFSVIILLLSWLVVVRWQQLLCAIHSMDHPEVRRHNLKRNKPDLRI